MCNLFGLLILGVHVRETTGTLWGSNISKDQETPEEKAEKCYHYVWAVHIYSVLIDNTRSLLTMPKLQKESVEIIYAYFLNFFFHLIVIAEALVTQIRESVSCEIQQIERTTDCLWDGKVGFRNECEI